MRETQCTSVSRCLGLMAAKCSGKPKRCGCRSRSTPVLFRSPHNYRGKRHACARLGCGSGNAYHQRNPAEVLQIAHDFTTPVDAAEYSSFCHLWLERFFTTQPPQTTYSSPRNKSNELLMLGADLWREIYGVDG